MTTTPVPYSTDEPLPGLGDPDPTRTSDLEAQVRRSLAFMADHGLVDGRHAGLMQLALELARSIRPGEKAYGVAQCAAQLIATFDKLMPDEEGGPSDGFDELRAYLAGVDAAGSGPQVRDPS
jgi:hypothetical protein